MSNYYSIIYFFSLSFEKVAFSKYSIYRTHRNEGDSQLWCDSPMAGDRRAVLCLWGEMSKQYAFHCTDMHHIGQSKLSTSLARGHRDHACGGTN